MVGDWKFLYQLHIRHRVQVTINENNPFSELASSNQPVIFFFVLARDEVKEKFGGLFSLMSEINFSIAFIVTLEFGSANYMKT